MRKGSYTPKEALQAIESADRLPISRLPQAQILARLEVANQALEEAKGFGEVKDIRDKVAAIEGYMRQQKAGVYAIATATAIKFRAEHRLGQMLKEMPKNEGTRRQLIGRGNIGGDTMSPPIDTPTYAELGINKKAASRYQQVASVPVETIEEKIEEAARKGESVTVSEVLKFAKRENRPEPKPAPPLPEGKFSLIYADPPWPYDFSRDSADDVENQYRTMTVQQIRDLEVYGKSVRELFHNPSVLFLWSTATKIPEAVRVMRAWGFKFKSSWVWHKSGLGLGYWGRVDHELILIGVKGEHPCPASDVRETTVVVAPKERHSKKPDLFRDRITRTFPNAKRIELFARGPAPEGWTVWGNEVTE